MAKVKVLAEEREDRDRWPDTTDPNHIYNNVLWMADNRIEISRIRGYIRRCLRLARQMGRKEGNKQFRRQLEEQGAGGPRMVLAAGPVAVIDAPPAKEG